MTTDELRMRVSSKIAGTSNVEFTDLLFKHIPEGYLARLLADREKPALDTSAWAEGLGS